MTAKEYIKGLLLGAGFRNGRECEEGFTMFNRYMDVNVGMSPDSVDIQTLNFYGKRKDYRIVRSEDIVPTIEAITEDRDSLERIFYID